MPGPCARCSTDPADYLPSVRMAQLERGLWYVPDQRRGAAPAKAAARLLVAAGVHVASSASTNLPPACPTHLPRWLWFCRAFFSSAGALGGESGSAGLPRRSSRRWPGPLSFAISSRPEPFLAATLTWTFWCFLQRLRRSRRERARSWMLAAWVGMALGTGHVQGAARRDLPARGRRHPGVAVASGDATGVAQAPPAAWRDRSFLLPCWSRPGTWRSSRPLPGIPVRPVHQRAVRPCLSTAASHRDSEARCLSMCSVMEHLVFFLPWTLYLSPQPSRAQTPRQPRGRRLIRSIARALILVAWFRGDGGARSLFSSDAGLLSDDRVGSGGVVAGAALGVEQPTRRSRPRAFWTQSRAGRLSRRWSVLAAFGTACWLQCARGELHRCRQRAWCRNPSGTTHGSARSAESRSRKRGGRLLPLIL